MKERWAHLPSLEWRCLDVSGRGLQEAFLEDSGAPGEPPFDVVLDKGFLDAYLSIDHEEAVLSEGAPAGALSTGDASTQASPSGAPPYDYRKAAAEYFAAVLDVLKTGGSFVLISLAQDYVLKEFVRLTLGILGCSVQHKQLESRGLSHLFCLHVSVEICYVCFT